MNSPSEITVPGISDPRVAVPSLFDRVATSLAGWPWWALVIIAGLIAMFYAIFTSSLYSRAFHAATDNFTLTTNRIAQVSYLVRTSDGKQQTVIGTLISENNDSVTLITQDEQQVIMPRSDVASFTCGPSQSVDNCPVNSTVTAIRGSIDGALIGQPSPGQYTVVTAYDQRETVDKFGVASETRIPDKCSPDPEGNCMIKLTLKPDYPGNQAKGVLLDNSAGLLTIQTAPPVTQTIKKTDIITENYRNPGACALNNLGSCEGIFITIRVTLSAFALAVILGLIFGLLRVSSNPIFTNIATLYVEVVRGIPILVLLLLVHFAFPPWLKANFPPAAPYLMLIVAIISIITAIYYLRTRWRHRMTEPFEFIQPVASSIVIGIVVIGFLLFAQANAPSPTEITRTILPQAFRVVLPPLGNEFIAMLKDSSLIAILAVADMTYKARIFAADVYRTFEPYITIAVLYLCMTLFLSLMVRVVERRVQLPR